MIAWLLATGTAAASLCDQGTTYDIRSCWAGKNSRAEVHLAKAYAAARTSMKAAHRELTPLVAAQTDWDNARDKTCAFEYSLYMPGTIAPQLGEECSVRMTQARAAQLTAFAQTLRNGGPAPAQGVSAAAQMRLDRLYGLYLARVPNSQRGALQAAQRAWEVYRSTACALQGGNCATALTNERSAELEASWVGEAFW